MPVASALLAPAGRLALLIGESQCQAAARLAPNFSWTKPSNVTLSESRVLFIGTKN